MQQVRDHGWSGFDLPGSGSVTIRDTAKGAFTIHNADKNGVSLFNKLAITGDGELDQVTIVNAVKCSTNNYRTGIV